MSRAAGFSMDALLSNRMRLYRPVNYKQSPHHCSPRVMVHCNFESPYSRHYADCAGTFKPILSSYTTRLTCSQSATGLRRQSAGNCSCPPRRISSTTTLGRYLRRPRRPFETCSTTSPSHLYSPQCFDGFVLEEQCRIARPLLG